MNDEWVEIAVRADAPSAEIVAGLLQSERIAVRLHRDEPVPGLIRSIRVLVPASAATRARSLIEETQITEEELASLAAEQPAADSARSEDS